MSNVERVTFDRSEVIYNSVQAQTGKLKDRFEIVAKLHNISVNSVERYYYLHKSRLVPVDKSGAKILIFDIETAPIRALVWGVFKQFIQPKFMLNDWFVLTWAAKWLGSDQYMSDRLTPDEVLRNDDKRVCVSLWDLLDQADIVVAYNGKKFDIPRIKTRFAVHKLFPTSPFQLVDPYQTVKKNFAFTRNTMDEVNRQLGLSRKIDTDAQLWLDVYFGKEEAIMEMEAYNIQDVKALEDNYISLRPWIISHPNVAIYNDDDRPQCHRCGSTDLTPDGSYVTGVSKFPTYRCGGCGGLTRGRRNENAGKKKQKQLLTSLAR